VLLDDGRGILALDRPPAGPDPVLRGVGDLDALLDLVLGVPGLDRAVAGVVVGPADLPRAADALRSRRIALGVRLGWHADGFGRTSAGRLDPRSPAAMRDGVGARGRGGEVERAVAAGARFARTGMVVTELSGQADLAGSARRCAAAALACLQAGLLPVVDCAVAVPPRSTLDASRARHATALAALAGALAAAGVPARDVVLCAGLVQAGPRATEVAGADRVATASLTAIRAAGLEPAAVAFRPGVQPRHLAANLCALRQRELPWPAGFCVGTSVLEPVVGVWRGRPSRVPDARRELVSRLTCLVTVLRAARPVA
jgi:fructose-bisphosphate aldolase, class I